MISFDVTKEDDELIHKIIDRAADLFAKRGSQLDRLVAGHEAQAGVPF